MPSSVLNDPSSGSRLSISYLGVDQRGERGEACANGVSGGDGASTGSDSMVSSGQASGEETKTPKQKSPLLSPNMELERARAKIRLLQKEVRKIYSRLSFYHLFSIFCPLCTSSIPIPLDVYTAMLSFHLLKFLCVCM